MPRRHSRSGSNSNRGRDSSISSRSLSTNSSSSDSHRRRRHRHKEDTNDRNGRHRHRRRHHSSSSDSDHDSRSRRKRSSSVSKSRSPSYDRYHSRSRRRKPSYSRERNDRKRRYEDNDSRRNSLSPQKRRQKMDDENRENSHPNSKTNKPSELTTASVSKSLTQGVFGRTGGAYIPPAKLRAMQAAITDKSSEEYQRMSWEALKKSINGLINKVNVSNMKNILPEMFAENLIRGRGLLCRSIMKAQAASIPFTHVYAAVIAVINTKFPQIGELIMHRLISQFRRAYKRNDKVVCLATSKFLAHLVNHRIAHEIIALQILTLLLERPTDDSVEVAVSFMRECGMYLSDVSSRAANAVFERFRVILHEGEIDKRTQYMIEVLFQVRRDKFKDHPSIIDELDIVEEEDQITHYVSLDDDLEILESLNVFKFDPDYLDNEEKYTQVKKEILGSDSEESGSESGAEGDSESDDEEENEQAGIEAVQQKLMIQDQTNTNLINLRRGIYLTIMSSLNFEECAHKLMKLDIPEQHKMELCNMIIECCSQERTYVNFYGLLGERFGKLNRQWAALFAQCFEDTYKTIHRFETNRLRNISKYFAHLLSSDAVSWNVFAIVRMTEQDTTSSSRIFLKILFQDLSEALGFKRLNDRLQDPNMVVQVGDEPMWVFGGLFPTDNPRNTRFSINYFTSIGLGALTESMREYLKNAPKRMLKEGSSSGTDSSSDSDSSSSSSGSSDFDSDSSSSSGSSSSSSSSGSSSSDGSSSSSDSDSN